ncbi:hypothetical protein AVEN_250835-1 [Araneus ventricosus]|uniref:Uncharacterized protein n=1 Tax=Araneus ventricosus TaxID=182803 RepID=A0A4Y2NVB6_ARAVE|nr:hypothetical protein AVEN_250835-1 [Araneus ventricosus]
MKRATYDEIAKFLPEEEQSNWKSAMDEEMLSMEKNKVWDLVDNSEKEKPITPANGILKGEKEMENTRLKSSGSWFYGKKEGVDHTETFFSSHRIPSLRLLVLILQENLHSTLRM